MTKEKILLVGDSLNGPQNKGAISQQCGMQTPLTAGKFLEPFYYNIISNDKCDSLKNERIGQSASTLSYMEAGSETKNGVSQVDSDIVRSIWKHIVNKKDRFRQLSYGHSMVISKEV